MQSDMWLDQRPVQPKIYLQGFWMRYCKDLSEHLFVYLCNMTEQPDFVEENAYKMLKIGKASESCV